MGAASERGSDGQQAKPFSGLLREASFRKLQKVMSRKSTAQSVDGGFTTFTSGINAGWQRELASSKFRQVGRQKGKI